MTFLNLDKCLGTPGDQRYATALSKMKKKKRKKDKRGLSLSREIE